MDKDKLALAETILNETILYSGARAKTETNHRDIMVDVYDAYALALAAIIAMTVKPENIDRVTGVVLEMFNIRVRSSVHESSRRSQILVNQLKKPDELESLHDRPAREDGQVS